MPPKPPPGAPAPKAKVVGYRRVLENLITLLENYLYTKINL
jgi:hypothetical protein